ncbi:MAG: replisome organizer [Bacillota bacterium]
MAERRMFSKQIIDSDMFLDMPTSAQALYFHLGMRADDEGFLNNPSKIMKIVGANKNDMDLLIIKKFIIDFPSGIIVIKHWFMHNYIQNDRFKPTVYGSERLLLDRKENKVYTLRKIHIDLFTEDDKKVNGYIMDTQVSIDKRSLEEVSIEEHIDETPISKTKHQNGSLKNVLLTDSEIENLKTKFADYLDRIENLSMYMGSTGKTYKSHYLTLLNWNRRDEKSKEDKNGQDSKSPSFKYTPRRNREGTVENETASDE